MVPSCCQMLYLDSHSGQRMHSKLKNHNSDCLQDDFSDACKLKTAASKHSAKKTTYTHNLHSGAWERRWALTHSQRQCVNNNFLYDTWSGRSHTCQPNRSYTSHMSSLCLCVFYLQEVTVWSSQVEAFVSVVPALGCVVPPRRCSSVAFPGFIHRQPAALFFGRAPLSSPSPSRKAIPLLPDVVLSPPFSLSCHPPSLAPPGSPPPPRLSNKRKSCTDDDDDDDDEFLASPLPETPRADLFLQFLLACVSFSFSFFLFFFFFKSQLRFVEIQACVLIWNDLMSTASYRIQ